MTILSMLLRRYRQISAFKDLPEPDYIVIMDNWFSATGFANTTAIIEATPKPPLC